tara:strand:+ start:302 stop:1105 length:804 start_codon:yes stop_codon:yes gene_type:complete
MKTSNFLIATALVVTAAACQKQEKEQANLDNDSNKDIAMGMTFDEEITNLGQLSIEGKLDGKKSTTWLSCVNFSIDTTGPVTKITLDFGKTNCQGDDGKYRRGKLIVTFEDNPFDAGSVTTITSNGYAINDHKIAGSKSVTYMGLNTDGDPYNTVNTALTITKPDASTILWNSTQQRVWVDGFGNFDPKDNAVEVTGTANGTTAAGLVYNIEILTPLRVEATCSNIVSGSFKLNGPTFLERVFDYGSGTCDRIATVTINGNTYTFLL